MHPFDCGEASSWLALHVCAAICVCTPPHHHAHLTLQVWRLAGTLLLSTVIASVLSVLTAAFILPTHASTEVQAAIEATLLASGLATSHYAARLFRPLRGSSSRRSRQAPSSRGGGSSSGVAKQAAPCAAAAGSTSSGEQTAGEGSADVAIIDAPTAAGKQAVRGEPAQQQQQQRSGDAAFFAAAVKASAHATHTAEGSYHLGEAGAAIVMSDVQTEEE